MRTLKNQKVDIRVRFIYLSYLNKKALSVRKGF